MSLSEIIDESSHTIRVAVFTAFSRPASILRPDHRLRAEVARENFSFSSIEPTMIRSLAPVTGQIRFEVDNDLFIMPDPNFIRRDNNWFWYWGRSLPASMINQPIGLTQIKVATGFAEIWSQASHTARAAAFAPLALEVEVERPGGRIGVRALRGPSLLPSGPASVIVRSGYELKNGDVMRYLSHRFRLVNLRVAHRDNSRLWYKGESYSLGLITSLRTSSPLRRRLGRDPVHAGEEVF